MCEVRLPGGCVFVSNIDRSRIKSKWRQISQALQIDFLQRPKKTGFGVGPLTAPLEAMHLAILPMYLRSHHPHPHLHLNGNPSRECHSRIRHTSSYICSTSTSCRMLWMRGNLNIYKLIRCENVRACNCSPNRFRPSSSRQSQSSYERAARSCSSSVSSNCFLQHDSNKRSSSCLLQV